MTIAVRGDDGHLRQVLAQLERLIEVLDVTDLTSAPHVELELVLVELAVPASPDEEQAVLDALASAGGETVSRDADVWRARLTASPDVIDRALEALRANGLRSLVRAGAVAMAAHPHHDSDTTPPENGAPRA